VWCPAGYDPDPRAFHFYGTPIVLTPTLIPRCPRLVPASPSEYTTFAAPSTKGGGRLIRCTVPGSTPNCAAILRAPGRPGLFRGAAVGSACRAADPAYGTSL
jgi:hypothetical protein